MAIAVDSGVAADDKLPNPTAVRAEACTLSLSGSASVVPTLISIILHGSWGVPNENKTETWN